MQINELVPADSPVNSVCHVIDPLCECNVELELSVPSEPVRVNQNDDQETDVIVQSLSQLPIQMRSSLLDDLRGTPTSSSVSSSAMTSVPTTPIFSLKRRSSVDSVQAFINKQPASLIPTPPPQPDLVSSSRKSEVLSVKTLANMFDFKVVTSIPFRPCSARLEDNRIFQRMAKQLDNDNETDC